MAMAGRCDEPIGKSRSSVRVCMRARALSGHPLQYMVQQSNGIAWHSIALHQTESSLPGVISNGVLEMYVCSSFH